MNLRLLLAAGVLLVGPAAAAAEPSRADLAQVGVRARAGSHAPLTLGFRDAAGVGTTLGQALRGAPGLLVFEDFRCRTLCGPALSIMAAALRTSGLRPGRDFRLVSIGLNPREGPTDAAGFARSRLASDPALLANAAFLTGPQSSIGPTARALGYGYAYDPSDDQYVHPVSVFALSADGALAAVLPQTALTGAALRDAVGRARTGRPGSLVAQLQLLCHGLLPLSGRYDAQIGSAVRFAALIFLAGFGALLFRFMQARRRT